MRNRASYLVFALVAALMMTACGSQRRAGDVDEIREAGELRVVVRPGFSTAPSNGNGGFSEAALLAQLASRLDVQIRWIEAERHDHVLPMVRDGSADIGVVRFSPASLLMESIRATAAVDRVEDLLVAGRDSGLDSVD